MKKQYASPEMELLDLTKEVFLEASGEALSADIFGDAFGSFFGAFGESTSNDLYNDSFGRQFDSFQ